MKKLAILLSLVLVFGLAVSASAAVNVTGELKLQVTNFGTEKVGGVDTVVKKSFLDTFVVKDAKVNFASQVNDNLKVTLQTNILNNNLAFGNTWLDYKVGDIGVKAGKFRLGRGGQSDSFAGTYTGAAASFNFSGVKANAVLGLDPDKDSNTFAFNGSFAPVDGLTVYGDFIMPTQKGKKSSYGVAADYAVAGVTVFGEFGKKGDADVKAFGAKTKVANINVKGKYNLASKEISVNTDTSYDGMTFGVDFTKPEKTDLQITAYVKVAF